MKFKVALLVIAAILILVGAVAASGVPLSVAGESIWRGCFGSSRSVSGLLREVVPFVMLGSAVFLALRAGLFNIGADGQFLVGALTSATVALKVPNFGGLILGLLGGIVAGALWAFPAGWIRAYRGGHEVITTIMLNNIAALLATSMVSGPIKDPSQESTTTAILANATWLPMMSFGEVKISLALPVAVFGVIGFAYWLRRSVKGFELEATGANAGAATFAGIEVKSVQLRAMVASGAVAGLTGAIQVLAFEHRFYSNFSPGYGFDALGVALLAGASPLGILPAALGFGILSKSATALSIEGIPKGITTLIVGLLIVILAAMRYRRERTSG
ncbi:MAG TPA: ABC transporter permease [Fimbriimonadaceae bacterium]|nr:ABC transporter permease [Fimbriimonadaceae bacterium]